MADVISPPEQWKHAVAGCSAGLVSALGLHPLDVVKTRLQVQDGAARGLFPQYKGTVDALRSIVNHEGWKSLYAGLTPALLGAGVSWGLYFFAYNRAKERYQGMLEQTKLSPQLHLLSAAEAGALVVVLTNPIWVIKTRMELQRGRAPSVALAASKAATSAVSGLASSASAVTAATASGLSSTVAASAAQASRATVGGGASTAQTLGGLAGSATEGSARRVMLSPYSNMAHAVRQIARDEGFRGFYRGLAPSLLLVSHGAIQFMVYEELKSLAASMGAAQGRSHHEVSSVEIVGMGALSKLAATVITYPSQVVRSRLQQRMQHRAIHYKNGFDVLRITLRREGWRGLYKGIVPNVMRVMPQSAVTFLAYETIMRQLKALDTKKS